MASPGAGQGPDFNSNGDELPADKEAEKNNSSTPVNGDEFEGETTTTGGASDPPRATQDHGNQPLKPMSEEVAARWKGFTKAIVSRNKIQKVLESFRGVAGDPCTRCAAMKLTEAKFIIADGTENQRANPLIRLGKRPFAAIDQENDQIKDEAIGPDGLEFGPSEYRLGTLEELESRRQSCPFCRLAAGSLEEQLGSVSYEAKTTESPEEELFLKAKVDCFVSWQIDGRTITRDRDGNIQGNKACTRRIRLRWANEDRRKDNKPAFHDTYVVLMAGRTAGRELFLGRSVENVKPDAALIQRWIGLCESCHGDLCKSKTSPLTLSKAFFGVIDVIDMCLTHLPDNGRYIALSYTWGKNQYLFQTKKKDIKGLLAVGGIRQWMSAIPRTIRDAIDLVTNLGERYLWVDSLCIIQDSERSWALNSRIMDIVYGNAYLTICAADGENAHAGLEILHPSRHSPTQTFKQNIAQYSRDLRLMSTMPAETYIKQSPWNTRGWTFQERLLSPRNVIFAGGRVFFQCRCTARSVDIITEHESAGWSIEFKDSPPLILKKLDQQPLWVYKKSLELYMMRNLTRQKDIIAAFTGIGNLVCNALGGDLIFGLPSSHFDWALLWEPQNAAIRRENEDNEQFPSWSWCGWKKEIMEYKKSTLVGCEDNLHDWLMHHTWITWYIRDGSGNLRLVWDRKSPKQASTTTESRWRGYTYCAAADSTTHDKYGRFVELSERSQRNNTAFKLILDECPYGVNITEYSEKQSIASTEKDMPYLQFFTWRAFFRIREDRRPPRSTFGRNFIRYSVLDCKNDWCGTIILDKFWVRDRKLEEEGSTVEFIALSDAKHFSEVEYDGWANYIPIDQEESTWDLYYALLIEKKAGISYRVGLGKVFKHAFDNSCKAGGKEWKEFILG